MYTGYESGAVYSFSVNDNTVSHSSFEAEIKAIDMQIRNMIYIKDIMNFTSVKMENKPMVIYTDSKSSVEILKTLKSNNKVRHLNMRINYIRECINSKIVEIVFMSGNKNVADMLSKPLPPEIFERHRSHLLEGWTREELHGELRGLAVQKVIPERQESSI